MWQSWYQNRETNHKFFLCLVANRQIHPQPVHTGLWYDFGYGDSFHGYTSISLTCLFYISR